jgi:hypothetical protein
LNDGWTALQSWDPDTGEGALLAFRQSSDQPARDIALHDIPPGHTYDLYSAPDDTPIGTVTSADLASGLHVELPAKQDAEVILIRPHA